MTNILKPHPPKSRSPSVPIRFYPSSHSTTPSGIRTVYPIRMGAFQTSSTISHAQALANLTQRHVSESIWDPAIWHHLAMVIPRLTTEFPVNWSALLPLIHTHLPHPIPTLFDALAHPSYVPGTRPAIFDTITPLPPI